MPIGLILLFLSIQVICSQTALTGPLSSDFQSWLVANGYSDDDFVRSDYGTQGSYGGKTSSVTGVSNTPVIFVHGNSDSALKTSKTATGWDNTIEYFLTQGYTSAELYATSWGDTNALRASTRTHNCHDIQRLRRFIQAVLSYTSAPKVSLVTHSMGVTLMRKAIKGGKIEGQDGSCNVGISLARNVEVFVGLSGGNYGLCNCEGLGEAEATCNKNNGLWPGDSCGLNYLTCGATPLPWPCSAPSSYSQFLTDLNRDLSKEGDYVFSVWSLADDVIMYGDQTWGRPTSLIPTSSGKVIYATYTHMQTKELTAADQYTMVHSKKIPNKTEEPS